ncbi:MAG: MazG nucleotide pyrophosphohydrolase domain-containing protein [Myxococcota bacterium]|nr:MazG nucleotide pyrophosphohydrolase domain-containing protein [Myxococcota bacterium]
MQREHERDGVAEMRRIMAANAAVPVPNAGALLEQLNALQDASQRSDELAILASLSELLGAVLVHIQRAERRSAFSFEDVLRGVEARQSLDVPQCSGAEGSRLDCVARAQPAIGRALGLSERAAQLGFDWEDAPSVLEKVHEELTELEHSLGHSSEAVSEELGDLLFALVNLGRKLGVDAETALHQCCEKFSCRFEYMEARLRSRGQSPESSTMDALEALWQEAKRARVRSGGKLHATNT